MYAVGIETAYRSFSIDHRLEDFLPRKMRRGILENLTFGNDHTTLDIS